MEDTRLVMTTSLLFSIKDFTTRDGFCLSIPVLKMVVTYLDCYCLSKGCNENEILRLFDKDKSIFLYADGCIRSGYIKEVLSYLEYENVFVLGGFYEYEGEHLVLGDGIYRFGNTFYNTYLDESTNTTYIVYGKLDLSRKINEIRFDVIDNDNTSIRDTLIINSSTLDIELTILENYIVYDLVTFTELYDSLLNLEDSGYSTVSDLDSVIINNLINLIEDFTPVK